MNIHFHFSRQRAWFGAAISVSLFLVALGLSACGGGEATPAPTSAPVEAATPAAETPAPAATTVTTDTTSAAETPAPAATAVTTDTTSSAGTPVPANSADKVPAPAEVAQGEASKLDPAARNNMYKAAPEMKIDPKKFYYATFKTDRGDIKVQLFADRSPQAVNSFVFLARDGFYNNTTFHRVLEGFMAQGGDPTGSGSGGPGYQFNNEVSPSLNFDREGLLAMANSGPDTNGSQFFITFAPADYLNGGYTIFGEVVEGKEVLSKITRRDPQENPNFVGDTLYTVLIEEKESSVLPPPPTPTPTPTPFAPNGVDNKDRPLAKLTPAERTRYFNTAPSMVIDSTKQYTATVKTAKGEIVIALFAKEAPIAVNNFVVLANLGFYDGLPINQNSPGNVVVVGSPDNQPTGDVGYHFVPELNIPITPTLGSLAYVPFREASGDITASGSQLVIAQLVPPPTTSAQYSFFGKIVKGVEVLAQLTTEDKFDQVTITEAK